jgi:hypothetical protein
LFQARCSSQVAFIPLRQSGHCDWRPSAYS